MMAMEQRDGTCICEVKCSTSKELMKMMIWVMDSLNTGYEVSSGKMTKARVGYNGPCKGEGQARGSE